MTSSAPAPADLRLRALHAGDEEFLYRVYASTRAEELAPLGWAPDQVDAFLRMQHAAQRDDYWRNYDTSRFSVVVAGGADAGRFYVEARADELRIIDIALLPAFRGRGIGSALITGLFAEADGALLPVRIHVEHANPAQRLYQRLGFAFAGEAGGVYRLMERPPRASARVA
jgi:ribosomal protein S18 acetylase RimI-like enzyme